MSCVLRLELCAAPCAVCRATRCLLGHDASAVSRGVCCARRCLMRHEMSAARGLSGPWDACLGAPLPPKIFSTSRPADNGNCRRRAGNGRCCASWFHNQPSVPPCKAVAVLTSEGVLCGTSRLAGNSCRSVAADVVQPGCPLLHTACEVAAILMSSSVDRQVSAPLSRTSRLAHTVSNSSW